MEREAFLARIRARLGRQGRALPPARVAERLPQPIEVSPFASRPPPADPALRFQSELERVGGEVHIADDLDDARAALAAEIERWDASRVLSWARSEFSDWRVDWLWDERGVLAWGEPPIDDEDALRRALLEAQIGITTVDYAIHTTGSLVLSAAPARPRAMSLLPTVHIALVRESQLRPTMGDALSAFSAGLPSALYFVTGPSRTSDIENDLTIGVHGPAAVCVILWRDAPAGSSPS